VRSPSTKRRQSWTTRKTKYNEIPESEKVTIEDVFYSFGISHPGAITLHNYPEFLRNLTVPEHTVQGGSTVPGRQLDLAATDIMRDRERGVPRYNLFRQLLNMAPVRSFDELTSNKKWAEELREIYGGDVNRVDTLVGMFAEDLPAGFWVQRYRIPRFHSHGVGV
jgi:hypothetical protein